MENKLTKLCELAFKYKTDKCPQIKHNYTPYYYKLFNRKKKQIKKILEIGVGEGASLRMWREYFPEALIYGAEIDPKRIFKDERIEVFPCNQSSELDLIKVIDNTGSDLDIVIDDGSHIPEHQVFSCLTLMPLLSSKVTYIIEDVADPSIAERLNDYELTMTKFGKRYDDRLILVRHKNG